MSFEESIKYWVAIDNQLKTLNEKTKELREKKNTTDQFINLNKWYTQHINKQQYINAIDKSTDKEFLNILNEAQNFKDKIKVELIFNSIKKLNN